MIGNHVFKITAQPAPEQPELILIDVHHKCGDKCTQHSWMGEIKGEDLLDSVVELLRALYERA